MTEYIVNCESTGYFNTPDDLATAAVAKLRPIVGIVTVHWPPHAFYAYKGGSFRVFVQYQADESVPPPLRKINDNALRDMSLGFPGIIVPPQIIKRSTFIHNYPHWGGLV